MSSVRQDIVREATCARMKGTPIRSHSLRDAALKQNGSTRNKKNGESIPVLRLWAVRFRKRVSNNFNTMLTPTRGSLGFGGFPGMFYLGKTDLYTFSKNRFFEDRWVVCRKKNRKVRCLVPVQK